IAAARHLGLGHAVSDGDLGAGAGDRAENELPGLSGPEANRCAVDSHADRSRVDFPLGNLDQVPVPGAGFTARVGFGFLVQESLGVAVAADVHLGLGFTNESLHLGGGAHAPWSRLLGSALALTAE